MGSKRAPPREATSGQLALSNNAAARFSLSGALPCDKNFSWDGTYNDQIMGPATYSYVIKFTHIEKPNLGIQTQYGSISLIR